MQDKFIDSLSKAVDAEWARIKQGAFHARITQRPVSRELYREMMMQVYHYTRHNSTNQAVCAFVDAPEKLLKFVYRHATEELGHEWMAVRDLKSVDLFREEDLSKPPLPATEALIGYLYSVALRYGPVPRLGYSFWAESSYAQIDGWLKKIAADLSLGKQNMTFFSSHIQADVGHAAQVEQALREFVTTPQQQAQVTQVARTTLFLTGQLLDQVARLHD
jgi:pyrroloquinoline quinone (PQQ) biosynthesis protein C